MSRGLSAVFGSICWLAVLGSLSCTLDCFTCRPELSIYICTMSGWQSHCVWNRSEFLDSLSGPHGFWITDQLFWSVYLSASKVCPAILISCWMPWCLSHCLNRRSSHIDSWTICLASQKIGRTSWTVRRTVQTVCLLIWIFCLYF